MYRPNRIGPWPVFNTLSNPFIHSSTLSRFTAGSLTGISIRPSLSNIVVSDRNDAAFSIRNMSLPGSTNNVVCPSILLRSDYDDVPVDGMMVSISGSCLSFSGTNDDFHVVDMVFGLIGNNRSLVTSTALAVGSNSYRILPTHKSEVSCAGPSSGDECFMSSVSYNGSIIVPGGHSSPFYLGFLIRNVSGSAVSNLYVDGMLSGSVYRGDLDVFDPVR